jgi:hypothetical protein
MFIRSVLIATAMIAPTALADAGRDQDQTVTKVSLVDLQTKCTDLQANPQIKPIKVTVTCDELSYFWKAGEGKPSSLENTRNIGAMVQMKGFQVAHDWFPADADKTNLTCQSFVKYEHKVQGVDVELTCAQLAEIDDLGAFCEPIVSQRITDDPGLVSDVATRETITLCPNGDSQRFQQ